MTTGNRWGICTANGVTCLLAFGDSTFVGRLRSGIFFLRILGGPRPAVVNVNQGLVGVI